MNTYHAFYKGKKIEISADTSYLAQLVAAKIFKTKKYWEVSIVLAGLGKENKEIVHSTAEIG